MRNDENHNGGAVMDGGRADRKTIVRLLNGALASEIVCVLRYQRHHFMAAGIQANAVAREFLTYANEEQRHAELIATRITQLDGKPMFSPDGLLTANPPQCAERNDLIEMIREDLVAERIAIEAYGEMIRYFGTDDPTSRRLFEEILANEEQHAGDLTALIDILRCEERAANRRYDARISPMTFTSHRSVSSTAWTTSLESVYNQSPIGRRDSAD